MGLFGDILGTIGGAVTSIIPGPVDDAILAGAKNLLGGGGNGNGSWRGPRAGTAVQKVGQQGFFSPPLTPQQVPQGGTGITSGRRFDINPPFAGRPGVGIGFQSQDRISVGERRSNGARGRGQAVPMLGHQGVQPMVESRPTRQCPTGMVLAKDGLCYDKRLVTKRFRMWPPAKKPPISVSEMNALRAAKRVEKKVKRLGRKITPEGRKTLKLED